MTRRLCRSPRSFVQTKRKGGSRQTTRKRSLRHIFNFYRRQKLGGKRGNPAFSNYLQFCSMQLGVLVRRVYGIFRSYHYVLAQRACVRIIKLGGRFSQPRSILENNVFTFEKKQQGEEMTSRHIFSLPIHIRTHPNTAKSAHENLLFPGSHL